MKPFTSLLTAALLSAASLSACGGSEKHMSIQEQTEKRFQLNPHPTKAYRIKIKINDAPGPLKLVSSRIQYIADNCSYIINNVEGASANPEKFINVEFQQTTLNEYKAIIYLDRMQNEDYFGTGICQWKAGGFNLGFQATGKPEETTFSIGGILDSSLLVDERSKKNSLLFKLTETRFYWKKGYPYYRNEDGSIYESNTMADSGIQSESLNKYYTDQQRKNLFNITVTLEEMKS
ncbi:MAG: hypothetical protein Q4A84_00495 [Neisseria sp.]|uniref:hypothetical protein n=1 Tax=Neisseria sp. TaxID=192066 RepID=UPI0026DAB9DC|nr:hypothetical protein [Neisseria sp.]MDO4640174.1 hypothetical protein [Neisseria sp.]